MEEYRDGREENMPRDGQVKGTRRDLTSAVYFSVSPQDRNMQIIEMRVVGALLCALVALARANLDRQVFLKEYPSDVQLQEWLDNLVAPGGQCEGLGRVFSIGKTVQGREIWGIEISDRPGQYEPEPNLKMVGNLHGDEALGRSLLPAFADYLCENYKKHKDEPPVGPPGSMFMRRDGSGRWLPSVESDEGKSQLAFALVRDAHVFLIPSGNPDGAALHRRENANLVDLNRNFPDPIRDVIANPQLNITGIEQEETKHLAAFLLSRHFVSSLALHEGALVANYPWDGSTDGRAHVAPSPDHATFQHLARLYARAHPVMWRNPSGEFPDGITNGAQWYPIYGGMQDYNYVKGGCMELTIELDDFKTPPKERLPEHFTWNLGPFLLYPWRSAYGGAWGRVIIANSSSIVRRVRSRRMLQDLWGALGVERRGELRRGVPVKGATVKFGTSPLIVPAGPEGEFYRPFAPGQYEIEVSAPGYYSKTLVVNVPEDGTGAHVLLELHPEPGTQLPPILQPQPQPSTVASAASTVDLSAENKIQTAGGATDPSNLAPPHSQPRPSHQQHIPTTHILPTVSSTNNPMATGKPQASQGYLVMTLFGFVPVLFVAMYFLRRGSTRPNSSPSSLSSQAAAYAGAGGPLKQPIASV